MSQFKWVIDMDVVYSLETLKQGCNFDIGDIGFKR
jgi:hypothetical protein